MSQLMAGPPPGKRWSVDGPTWQRILAEVRRELRAEVEMELAEREPELSASAEPPRRPDVGPLKRLDGRPKGARS